MSLLRGGQALLQGGTVTTTESQTYQSAVQLGVDTTLSGSQVALTGTVDGSHALTVLGTATFAGNVGVTQALTALLVQGPATVTSGEVITAGNQQWQGPLAAEGTFLTNGGTFTAGNTLTTVQDVRVSTTGGSVTLGGSVFGPGRLILDGGTGTVTALAPLGVGVPLASFSVNGGLVSLVGVTTVGTQILQGAAIEISGLFTTQGGEFQLNGPTVLTGNAAFQTGGGVLSINAPLAIAANFLQLSAGRVAFNAGVTGEAGGWVNVNAGTAVLGSLINLGRASGGVGRLTGNVTEVIMPTFSFQSLGNALDLGGSDGRIFSEVTSFFIDFQTSSAPGFSLETSEKKPVPVDRLTNNFSLASRSVGFLSGQGVKGFDTRPFKPDEDEEVQLLTRLLTRLNSFLGQTGTKIGAMLQKLLLQFGQPDAGKTSLNPRAGDPAMQSAGSGPRDLLDAAGAVTGQHVTTRELNAPGLISLQNQRAWLRAEDRFFSGAELPASHCFTVPVVHPEDESAAEDGWISALVVALATGPTYLGHDSEKRHQHLV